MSAWALDLRRLELDDDDPDWDRLATLSRNIFATREWALAWWRAFGAGHEPNVTACLREDGTTAAVLSLYEARSFPMRVLRFIGHGPADQLGPACAPADRPLAASALRSLVDRGLVVAERLLERDGWDGLLGGEVVQRQPSPLVAVRGRTWDEFLSSRSSNFRDQARRRERRLSRSHEVTIRLTERPEQLADDLTALFRLHAARWGDQPTAAFAGAREAMHRDFAAQALRRGWLRLWTLDVDGEPAASWYGFRFGGLEWYYQSGREPRFERDSVGFVLMVHALRAAIEDGVEEFRLLLGDEQYKQRFADAEDTLVTVALTGGVAARAAASGARAVMAMPAGLRRAVKRVAAEP